MSQINLQHGTTTNSGETGRLESQSRRRNDRLWWEGFAEKESFKPGVKKLRGDG